MFVENFVEEKVIENL